MGKKRPFYGQLFSGISSRQGKDLDKEYGKGNWNLSGGKGYAASGTTRAYRKGWGGYRDIPVYSKLPTPAPAPAAPPPPAAAPPPPPQQQQQTLPVQNFPEPQAPDTSAADALAAQIAQMQAGFMQSMQQQQAMFQQMQASQSERMEALQQQMLQSQIAQQQRPEVAGVKMAEGAAGTPMQIARRGVTGAFGRRGMRISSLNV